MMLSDAPNPFMMMSDALNPFMRRSRSDAILTRITVIEEEKKDSNIGFQEKFHFLPKFVQIVQK
jgi:hypothetical protein